MTEIELADLNRKEILENINHLEAVSQVARDRAEEENSDTLILSMPAGDYDDDLEIKVTAEGLKCNFALIPWEWIDRARQTLTSDIKSNS